MTTEALAGKSCTPCQGGVSPLTSDEATDYLNQVPAWTLLDVATRIERAYTFKTFKAAYRFVTRVAEIAEAEGHHPDVCFGWGYATISLQTKKIGGLHQNDFIMAAKFDAAADELSTTA